VSTTVRAGLSAPLFLLSDDPLNPRSALLLDADQDWFPELIDVCAVDMTSATPTAQVATVHDRIALNVREARWLVEELTKWIAKREAE